MKYRMSKLNKKTKEAIKAYSRSAETEIPSDVLGSYTGQPETKDKNQVPVQDADDL